MKKGLFQGNRTPKRQTLSVPVGEAASSFPLERLCLSSAGGKEGRQGFLSGRNRYRAARKSWGCQHLQFVF